MNALEKTIKAFLERKPFEGLRCVNPRTNREGLNGLGERITSTDGRVFYSYAMPIAVHTKDGTYVLLREHAPSVTTQKHVDALTRTLPRNAVQLAAVHLAEIERTTT